MWPLRAMAAELTPIAATAVSAIRVLGNIVFLLVIDYVASVNAVVRQKVPAEGFKISGRRTWSMTRKGIGCAQPDQVRWRGVISTRPIHEQLFRFMNSDVAPPSLNRFGVSAGESPRLNRAARSSWLTNGNSALLVWCAEHSFEPFFDSAPGRAI